jgi:hypothetical protein
MAGEAGDKNEMISDADKKLDALCDMLKDACMKMDEGGKRLDARMDAMEENFKRADARMDAMSKKDEDEEEEEKKDRKDARKDGEEEPEMKGEPKQVAADKRKDSEDEKSEEKKDRKDARKDDDDMMDRKDARKDSEDEEKKEGEVKDSQYMTKAEAAALRAQIAELSARAPAILSTADRERFARIQEQADPVFQAFNDRAPAPLDGETPTQYKRRLGGKLQAHSPKWKDSRLSAVSDEAMLDTVLADIYADSMTAARRGVEVPRGTLRAIERQSGGHTIIEYQGDADSWMNSFAGHSQRATGNWLRPH